MARSLIDGRNIVKLSLDEIAWSDQAVRKPLSESRLELEKFLRTNTCWVIEGCYGDLVDVALPYCDELRFLNPGVETCIEHCRARPWEPEKYSSPDAQEEMLDTLISWVKEYENRDDEYGLKRHRKIFESFPGLKREYLTASEYSRSNN